MSKERTAPFETVTVPPTVTFESDTTKTENGERLTSPGTVNVSFQLVFAKRKKVTS